MKRSKVKFETEDGQIIPGTLEDDGIRVVQRFNLNDIPPGWHPSPADPLDTDMEAARRYLDHVATVDPATLGEGDQRAAMRLRAELGNLRDVLDGGDVRHAVRAGAEFGKALEEMRERLVATDRGKQVKARAEGRRGGKKGGDERKRLAVRGAEEYCKHYRAEMKKDPAKPGSICRRVAAKYGAEVKSRFHCGASYKTVERAVFGKAKKTK